MAAHHNIHTPDDDNYYHCPNNDCPCNNVAAYYDGADALIDSLANNSQPIDIDAIIDHLGDPCSHNCCRDGYCSCDYCPGDCPTCDNYQHHDNDSAEPR
jgi:hypothetical protein